MMILLLLFLNEIFLESQIEHLCNYFHPLDLTNGLLCLFRLCFDIT
jgi:hypothetical protein